MSKYIIYFFTGFLGILFAVPVVGLITLVFLSVIFAMLCGSLAIGLVYLVALVCPTELIDNNFVQTFETTVWVGEEPKDGSKGDNKISE